MIYLWATTIQWIFLRPSLFLSTRCDAASHRQSANPSPAPPVKLDACSSSIHLFIHSSIGLLIMHPSILPVFYPVLAPLILPSAWRTQLASLSWSWFCADRARQDYPMIPEQNTGSVRPSGDSTSWFLLFGFRCVFRLEQDFLSKHCPVPAPTRREFRLAIVNQPIPFIHPYLTTYRLRQSLRLHFSTSRPLPDPRYSSVVPRSSFCRTPRLLVLSVLHYQPWGTSTKRQQRQS